ncbi:major facilitator superfamily domain-containing protein 1-like isoform X4 [Portunus trituberculatus]|uniref:major facilitator superfamily domain-containing protein 1-like isoform X4 n=1 Tax=Portunus trituberculatus TaxID=210409 RepID=UPI001E1D070E|nr:major facilitator superfamily domain-containing protein 1-like isoform X4 [Portunus trituberculatus]
MVESSVQSDADDNNQQVPSVDIISGTVEAEPHTNGSEDHEEEISGCGAQYCCNPNWGPFRFIALFFMCFLGFGSYFCFDTPGSLQDYIKDEMKVDTVAFASLYSLYSWPNVVLCFIGGFLIDSIGGESLAVAQNTYTVSWFKGKELNTVFGLQLSMARVGSTVNFLSMVPLYEWVQTFSEGYQALGYSLLFAGITCVFSLGCALILGVLDNKRSKVLHLDAAQSGEKIKLSDILTFPASFWLISIICVAYYVAIFPFIGLAKVFFMRKYDLDATTANSVSSVVYLISAIASPILGNLVDRTGRNVTWVFMAVLITLGCHAMLTFTFWSPFISMSILGLAYSLLASALWPMVALIIPEHQLGTAYGIMQSVQNLGLAVISIVAGLIVDTSGYMMLEMFYMIWLCIALVATIAIALVDSGGDGYLLMSAATRKRDFPHPPADAKLNEAFDDKL